MIKKDKSPRQGVKSVKKIKCSPDDPAGTTVPASGNRLSGIIEHTQAGYFFIDTEGCFRQVNPAWLRMHGYDSPEDIIGRHFSITQVDADLNSAHPNVADLLSGHPIPTGEFARRCKDGSIGYHTFSASPVLLNGNVVGLEGFIIDTTEHRRMEEKLRDSEDRYRTVADFTYDWEYWIGPEGNLIYVSPSCEHITGYSPEELQANPDLLAAMIHPDDRAAMVEHLHHLDAGVARHLEYRIITKNNVERWISHRCQPVYDSTGHWIGRRASNRDITRRKQAETELKRSEEKFAKAFKASPASITIASMDDGKYFDVNDVFLKITGFTRDEVVGHTSTELNVWVDMESRRRFAEELSANGFLQDFEIQYRMRKGEVRDFLVSSEIIELDGKPCSLNYIFDVTDRKQAEKKLRESERKYRLITENMSDNVWLMDLNLKTFFISPSVTQTRGFNLDEIRELPISTHLMPESLDRVLALWQKEITEEHLNDRNYNIEQFIELEFIRKDGTTLWTHVRVKLVRDESGIPLHLLCVSRDITERKQVEETLRESEEKFRDLVEDINDVIYAMDKEGRYTYISPAVQSLFGYSPEEFLKRPLGELVHPDDRPLLIQGFQNVLAGIQQPNEYRIFNKSGEIRWIRSSSKPIMTNGVLTGIRGIATDITQKKLAQEALRQSEETHRALVCGSPDIIMRFDQEGRHLFVSENIKDMAGIPASTFIGRNHRDLGFPESQCEFWEESIRKVFESGSPFETEFTFDSPYGAITFNWRLLPEIAAEGNVRSVLSISRDITAHRLAEQNYRTLFNEMLDGFALHEIICNEEGRPVDYRFLAINPAFERMTGMRVEDIVGRTVLDALPGTEQYWIETYGKVALTGKPAIFENYHSQLDKYFSVTAFRPAPNQFACIFVDITERKRIAQALSQSEEKFRKAFITSPDAVNFNRLEDGMYSSVNPGFTKLLGYTEEEVIGRTSLELNIWNNVEDRQKLVNGLQKDGSVSNLEATFRAKNGDIRYGLMSASTVELNGVRYILSITRDITERKHVEISLRESEAAFRMTFTQSPVGAVIVGLDNKFMSTNMAFCDFLGYSESELIGKKIADVTYPDDVEIGMPELKMMMEGKLETANTQKRYLRKNGKVVWGALTIGLVRDTNNTPLYFLPIIQDITERKQAEVKLRESEEKHRRLFETMAQGVVYHAADGQIISANPAAQRILGLSIDQMLGKTTMDPRWKMICEDGSDVAGTEHPSAIALRTGHAVGPVIRGVFHPAKNNYIWLSITAIPLFQPGETTPFQAYATFDDITERKQAQETLRKKDILLANLASQVPGMLFQFKRGPDGTYCVPYSSNGIRDIFGCSPEDVRDHFEPIFRAVLPEDREKVSQSIEASVQTLSPWICEYRVQVPGRPLKWILGTSTPEKLADGSIVWSGYDLDITESKQAQEELVSSNAKLHALWTIASLMDADIKTIADHILASITQMSASRYGFYGFINDDESVMTIHSWSGDAMADCKMADKPQHFPISNAGIWGEAVRRRKPFILNDCAAPHPAKKGLPEGHVTLTNLMVVPHFFQGRITAVAALANTTGDYGPDDVKEVTAFLDSVQMIVERRRVEEEKEKLQAQLTQAQKMESIGRLAGGVAHDFNNMLGVILGNTELAMDQAHPTSPLYVELREIRKAAERSADLTRQLLAFARKQTVTPRLLDLNQTMEGSLKMLQRLIGEDIELSWLPCSGLWPVMVDPSQMDQILANLCVNARDAIGETGIISIETGNISFDEAYCESKTGFVQGDFVMLSVSDNGCGMSRETLDRIFEPFFTTKELGKGTGLGLSTVYGIVKQNHGFINVYSEPGQGTTFKIYLPRHVGKSEQLPEKNPAQPAARGQETILLTEDEAPMLRMIRIMLERQGYKVLTASTPGEAIRLARENTGEIHLLVTDVIMPEMNGRDLAKNILTLYPNIKRLFMSGYTADVIAHRGMLEEGTNFIQKPFSKKDLAFKVRQVLDSE